ncbi:Nephrocystin-1-like [Oopsacas minuta]|uniref:Nephrocystin-1-like n=1 Tax=Oopsacas minuta TaxID=111878 RepID=A0AAV7K6W1_9METZ|nr:Nephrocystin-1-like [Oopsacas minuta]
MATPTICSITELVATHDYTPTDESETSEIELEYLYEVRALSEFRSQEPEDISFSKEEILYIIDDSRKDGWLLAYNEDGDQGLVPGNYVTVENVVEEEPKPKQTGASVWAKVRENMAPDAFRLALRGFGVTLPSGFRESTLAKFHTSTLSTRFKPKLSVSGLNFVDPCLKPTHYSPALERELSILYASNVPEVDNQLNVIKSQVRLCIFNRKSDILSNMLTLTAVMSSGDKKTWKLKKGVSNRDVILSVKELDPNLELVIELGVSYTKEDHQDELSTGWACVPLFKQGTALQNKTYGIKLNGGSLFEQGIELDPTANISNKKSIFVTNRKPTVFLRFSSISRSNRELITFLPDDVIIPKAYIPIVHRYQKLSSQILEYSSLNLSSPEIYVFLTALDRPLIMDTVVQLWNDINQNKRRTQRINDVMQNQCLVDFILQKMYPLITSTYLEEQLIKQDPIQTLTGEDESDSPLFAYNLHFTPFNISEIITEFSS